MTLIAITDKDNMKPCLRMEAKAYMEALLKNETILAATILLNIKRRGYMVSLEKRSIADATTEYKMKVHDEILDSHWNHLANGLKRTKNCIQTFVYLTLKLLLTYKVMASMYHSLKNWVNSFSDMAAEWLPRPCRGNWKPWRSLKLSDEYVVRTSTEDTEDGSRQGQDEKERDLVNESCSSCKNCPIRCYRVLCRYNLLTNTYHPTGLRYKFLRSSTLKFIHWEYTSLHHQSILKHSCLCLQKKTFLWLWTLME